MTSSKQQVFSKQIFLQQTNQKQVALVTGGLGGIGKSIVMKLLERGDFVIVFDCVKPEEEKVQNIKKIGAFYIKVDIANVSSIQDGFKKLKNLFLEKNIPARLDILVNNAGITKDNLAIRLSESDWDSVLDVNLKGLFFCCQQAIKIMMRQKKSYIINISSIVGLFGNAGQVNYAASKAGVLAVSKTLAKEYASRNILVNSIAPGFVQTDMTEKLSQKIKELALEHIPLKRFGECGDVANLVEFLTSGRADYITSQVICVDGGMS
jgi:3-oxoacyl-[acyl-carrier protein] reductase